jgi:hypothetical protein
MHVCISGRRKEGVNDCTMYGRKKKRLTHNKVRLLVREGERFDW